MRDAPRLDERLALLHRVAHVLHRGPPLHHRQAHGVQAHGHLGSLPGVVGNAPAVQGLGHLGYVILDALQVRHIAVGENEVPVGGPGPVPLTLRLIQPVFGQVVAALRDPAGLGLPQELHDGKVHLACQVQAHPARVATVRAVQRAAQAPPLLHVVERGTGRYPQVQVLDLEPELVAGVLHGLLLPGVKIICKDADVHVRVRLRQHKRLGPIVLRVRAPDTAPVLVVLDDALKDPLHGAVIVVAGTLDVIPCRGGDEQKRLLPGAHAGDEGIDLG